MHSASSAVPPGPTPESVETVPQSQEVAQESVATEVLHAAIEVAIEKQLAGDFQSAWLIYREILQVAPDHGDALHLGGVVAHQVGEHDSARQLISRAIELHPGIADFHGNLGEVHRALGDYAAADTEYRKALLISPNHSGASSGLVDLAMAMVASVVSSPEQTPVGAAE